MLWKKISKVWSIRKFENEFNRERWRYLCKSCAFSYTGTENGYPSFVKHYDI